MDDSQRSRELTARISLAVNYARRMRLGGRNAVPASVGLEFALLADRSIIEAWPRGKFMAAAMVIVIDELAIRSDGPRGFGRRRELLDDIAALTGRFYSEVYDYKAALREKAERQIAAGRSRAALAIAVRREAVSR